jgi:hypothetical protein
MFQTPALILSLALASAYAVIFFLWRGRGLRYLLFLWVAALAGFAVGQLLGEMWGWVSWTIGAVHVVEATIAAFVFLVIARWLAQGKKTS